MRVSIIKDNKIENIILPTKVFGTFWITDKDINGLEKNLISIEAKDNKWLLVSNNEAYYFKDSMACPDVVLEPNKFYLIMKNIDKKRILIYCSNMEEKYQYLDMQSYLDQGITIGNNNSFINYSMLNGQAAIIKKENNEIILSPISANLAIYVNDIRVLTSQRLKLGDIIFISGLKLFLILIEGKYYLAINNPNNQVSYQALAIGSLKSSLNPNFEEPKEEIEMTLYNENDYFHKTPRFQSIITPIEMQVDAPPTKADQEDNSLLLTIGPMLTMSMTSMVTGYTAVNNVLSGRSTWNNAMPSLIICIAMLCSVFIWPMFSKRYQKRKQKENERLRQQKYKQYIDSKKEIIKKGIQEQSIILKNNYPSTKECEQIILNQYTTLWQRRIEDHDFLEVNLGYGNYPMKIHIQYPEDHFSMAEDNLKDMVSNLGNEPKILNGVPVVFSLMDHFVSGVIGKDDEVTVLIKNILIQIAAFHSYDDLKIVILTSKENEYKWEFLKSMPHCFSDDRGLRFFATNNDEYKEVCYYLDRIFSKRVEVFNNNEPKRENLNQLYFIITDNFKRIRNYDVIQKIVENKRNYGFMVMIADQKVTNLPDQCKSFIQVNQKYGEIHNNIVSDIQKFEMDTVSAIDYEACSVKLANIPIEITSDNEGQLPNKVGFLEMYDVGKVEQLNSLTRWKNNNPVLRLESPVGIGKNGEFISIDLHEKYHGPHGLVAGMTGSGKSEFIITYILSMAINYHPYEVQFILIDYKGGGLAGAFENKTTGIKLPHLVGTITNLDTNEIKRSLASIESELKRRQALFNEAREISGESTIDIYKYQKMYREGLLKVPVSHLFIISDEFAELKTQQPEFMEQLISTARIGRSLGVHLILATQKPSGVVDPQIWSNTRFRVCMRVQEKGDSNEVIKCPDAAFLKQTGRFYFQVGYNEVFVLGQATYAGGKYYPQEKVVKNIDSSIQFINNIGYVVKTVETKEKREVIANGEELNNIVKYLADLAKTENIECVPLWLEKIPADIRVEALANKYQYQKEDFILNPIIGEYDIPNQQKQNLLTVPLSKEGNTLVFGASGSGKENFITTLLYSSMLYYDAKEVNYYLLDFGSETLKMFQNCPLVGDVLTVNDDDKIKNLYKMLSTIIEERKELFAPFNGDYQTYCKNSGKTVPNIVVVINNYEAYQENYSKFDDLLVVLTRECIKYGIYFLITVNTPNGIRFKLKQNFSKLFALQQNNEDDYITILGNIHKNYPAKIFGRGIIKEKEVYEFQTALVTEKENIPNYIKQKCLELQQITQETAKKIPVLPKVVGYKDIYQEFGKSNQLIIGIEKETLKVHKFDFIKNYITIVSSLDLSMCSKMINPLINQILGLGKTSLQVIQADDFMIDSKYTPYYQYEKENFNDCFTKLYDMVNEANNLYKESNYNKKILENRKKITCIIIGINSFKSKLSEDNKLKFPELFSMAKDLDIIHFIFVDSIDEFKKIELESWYKNCINNNNGIWIGNGLADQFTLKVSQKIDEMKEDVPNNFCFVLMRGKVTYVQFVEEFELKVNE